jgi:hypothetical protein
MHRLECILTGGAQRVGHGGRAIGIELECGAADASSMLGRGCTALGIVAVGRVRVSVFVRDAGQRIFAARGLVAVGACRVVTRHPGRGVRVGNRGQIALPVVAVGIHTPGRVG